MIPGAPQLFPANGPKVETAGIEPAQCSRRVLDYGDPAMAARFWSKVEKTDGCWIWKAARNRSTGYGAFCVVKPYIRGAHRVSYQMVYGPVPPGTVICHHCDNPACVRPDHLFAGTHADNVRDKVAKGRQARGERLNKASQVGGRNHAAKLTDAQVIEIRERVANGERPTDVAREFGIRYRTLWTITARKRWTHLP